MEEVVMRCPRCGSGDLVQRIITNRNFSGEIVRPSVRGVCCSRCGTAFNISQIGGGGEPARRSRRVFDVLDYVPTAIFVVLIVVLVVAFVARGSV